MIGFDWDLQRSPPRPADTRTNGSAPSIGRETPRRKRVFGSQGADRMPPGFRQAPPEWRDADRCSSPDRNGVARCAFDWQRRPHQAQRGACRRTPCIPADQPPTPSQGDGCRLPSYGSPRRCPGLRASANAAEILLPPASIWASGGGRHQALSDSREPAIRNPLRNPRLLLELLACTRRAPLASINPKAS